MLKHIIHSHEIGRRSPVEVLRRVCEWDFEPYQWSEEQIAAALGDGIIPTFDD